MNAKWKRKMIGFGWLALTIAVTATLIAGVSKKNNRLCSGINVEITEEDDHFFVDEKEVYPQGLP